MIERLFIDATYTLASGKNSGIERVVGSILRESTKHCPPPQAVISVAGKFYAATPRHVAMLQRAAALHADILSRLPTSYRVGAAWICRVTGSSKLSKWLLPQAGHLGFFKLPHKLYERSVHRKIVRTSQPLEFRAGDVLLLPDAYWVSRLRDSVWDAAAEARASQAFVATVLYDLIPLTHPEFVGRKRHDVFLRYLKSAATNSDLLLAISNTVRAQVANYLPSLLGKQAYCRDIRTFQLGAELSTAQGQIRSDVQLLFAGPETPYLMVATFDPRKNHTYVLDAFDELWKQQPELKLCLVGRVGSRCGDVVKRIHMHPRYGKQLILFSDLNDIELQHCYARARGVLFPSIVEGYGLPIVESLWHGRKTFASDTAIHREVGQQDCCYFKLGDPNSLVHQLLEWEAVIDGGALPQLPVRKPTSWQAGTEQIMEHCLSGLDAQRRQSSPSSISDSKHARAA